MTDLFSANAAPSLPFDLPAGTGYRATWNERWNGFEIAVRDGWLLYAERFFNPRWSDRIVEYFLENDAVDGRTARWRDMSIDEFERLVFTNIKWKQDRIKFYGKSLPLPRLTSWYGDPDRIYTYSGIKSHPNAWNEGLLRIKERVEAPAGVPFNSVLLNWYRDGQDHLSWHADDEKELGRDPVIASANFGAERDFLLRRIDDPREKISVPLKHGTLLVMGGSLQHFWQHSIPKRKGVDRSRFNMTFRRIGM